MLKNSCNYTLKYQNVPKRATLSVWAKNVSQNFQLAMPNIAYGNLNKYLQMFVAEDHNLRYESNKSKNYLQDEYKFGLTGEQEYSIGKQSDICDKFYL